MRGEEDLDLCDAKWKHMSHITKAISNRIFTSSSKSFFGSGTSLQCLRFCWASWSTRTSLLQEPRSSKVAKRALTMTLLVIIPGACCYKLATKTFVYTASHDYVCMPKNHKIHAVIYTSIYENKCNNYQ